MLAVVNCTKNMEKVNQPSNFKISPSVSQLTGLMHWRIWGACPAHAPTGPNSSVFAYIFTEKCPRRRSTFPNRSTSPMGNPGSTTLADLWGACRVHATPYGTQFFRFHIHFHQKPPASEVHAPPKKTGACPPYGCERL